MLSVFLLLGGFFLVVALSSLLLLHVTLSALPARSHKLRTRRFLDHFHRDWSDVNVQRQYKVLHPDLPLTREVDSSNYPVYESLLSILERWNPCHPDPPKQFRETLLHFNYSNPHELEMAERYRDFHLPFKLHAIPELEAAGDRWTIDYLSSRLRNPNKSRVEESDSRHFLFWKINEESKNANYKSPTRVRSMSFREWFRQTERDDDRFFYFMFSNFNNQTLNEFIYEDLPMFAYTQGNFFIPNPHLSARGSLDIYQIVYIVFTAVKFLGIECKVAPRGLISEAHFDGGRNMVGVVRGSRRVILAPPSACEHLPFIKDSRHPSFRQSSVDWCDIEEVRRRGMGSAQAIDTILQRGEVLFVPSWWFHYIVSLEYSVQCNTRFGTVSKELNYITNCLQQDK